MRCGAQRGRKCVTPRRASLVHLCNVLRIWSLTLYAYSVSSDLVHPLKHVPRLKSSLRPLAWRTAIGRQPSDRDRDVETQAWEAKGSDASNVGRRQRQSVWMLGVLASCSKTLPSHGCPTSRWSRSPSRSTMARKRW